MNSLLSLCQMQFWQGLKTNTKGEMKPNESFAAEIHKAWSYPKLFHFCHRRKTHNGP